MKVQKFKDKTRGFIAIMQAYVDGETIECRHGQGDEWETLEQDFPVWDFEDFDYRVKPEPFEGWVAITFQDSNLATFCHSLDDAKRITAPHDGRIIKVREVEDE